jgi:MFS family permease
VLGSSVFIAIGQQPAQGKILFISAILYGAGFAAFGLSPSFLLAVILLAFVGAADTVWGASRGTIMQMLAPEKFRGRVMGVFQLSNRGLHPLGQMETGLVVPLIGARLATCMGGLVISAVTLIIAWKVPALRKYRWDSESVRIYREKNIAT